MSDARAARRDERGASTAEYGLLAALVAGVIIASTIVLGQLVLDSYILVLGRF